MAEKKKVKYTPPKDITIPEELKKTKPMSSAAAAQEDIEENLPKSTRKEEGSEKSLSKIQDDLDKGDISSKEAHKKAGIEEDTDPIVVEEVKVTGTVTPKGDRESLLGKTDTPKEPKKEPVKKETKSAQQRLRPEKFRKITLEDGHTYHTSEKDAVCSNCMLPKNKTTEKCFKHELSPVGLRKFNDGLIDYVNGVWVFLNQDEKKK